MTRNQRRSKIECNASFGPIELDYYPLPPGSAWFAKWLPGYPAPKQGYKIHVSVVPEDAEIVARSVLPALRRLRIAHKVVRNLERYRILLTGSQQGKFITKYTSWTRGSPQRSWRTRSPASSRSSSPSRRAPFRCSPRRKRDAPQSTYPSPTAPT